MKNIVKTGEYEATMSNGEKKTVSVTWTGVVEKEGKRYTDTVYRFGQGNACTLIAGRTYKWVIGRV